MIPSVVLVAHRAGNDPIASRSLAARADLVELDVHRFKGQLEVRHAKALWPSRRLFEGRTLLPRGTPRPTLTAVLAMLPAEHHLWLDLKGPDPRLATEVASAIGDRTVWVSARCWWLLGAFHSDPSVRTFASVGTAWQRWLVGLPFFTGWSDGVVIHERLVDRRFMERRPPGSPVAAWSITGLDRAVELLSLGVTGLIIDDATLIDELRDALDGNGGR